MAAAETYPVHLDMGGHEPDGTLTLAPHQPPQDPGSGAAPGGPPSGRGPGPEGPPRASGWTTGRIASAVIGAVLALCSLGLLGAGGGAVWADTAQRHGGYVDLGTASYATAGRALVSGTVRVQGGWGWLRPLIGQVRIRATTTGQAAGVFAGVAPAGAARRYLSGVAYTTVTGYNGHGQQVGHPGSRMPPSPGSTPMWTAQAFGSPTAALMWTMRTGDWTVIVMNADRSPGVSVRADVGASLPALGWLATELLADGSVLALIALACIIIPVRMATVAPANDPAARS
jgi:hypothetical protein